MSILAPFQPVEVVAVAVMEVVIVVQLGGRDSWYVNKSARVLCVWHGMRLFGGS